MRMNERARAMRADGQSIAAIADALGIGWQWAYKCVEGVDAPQWITPKETSRSVVRYSAHNGGRSTRSGMAPVSLPRVVSIDGAYA